MTRAQRSLPGREQAVYRTCRNDRLPQQQTLELQLKRLVFPVIALYKTLCMHGYRKASALGLMRTMIRARRAEHGGRARPRRCARSAPFRSLQTHIRNFMEYQVSPSAGGWQCGGLDTGGASIDFRIEECLYRTITARFGCPELCAVFCDYERIAFAGLLPKIEFSCGGRLSEGRDFCSFSFNKGKKQKDANRRAEKVNRLSCKTSRSGAFFCSLL